jgi:hypothetical protein
MAKEYKLDLGQMLTAIDQRDFNWLTRQSPDAVKEFSPLMALRWAASLSNDGERAAVYLMLLNERVNVHLFELSKNHADLLFRLLASCGTGRMRRTFLKAPPQSSNNAAIAFLYNHHPLAKDREIEGLLTLYTRDEFETLLIDYGKKDDEIEQIMKAYDAIRG